MPNRLAQETSPYLLQHAGNPVDWYPWGEEALEQARREDKPILLSIGYASCHWCHVMARESFEDPEVAAAMNRLFVSIKVDREERPDLDQIYQTALALLTRRGGGWPLTMFLTADQVPFYGGTYFPREPRFGLPGFVQLLEHVARVHATRRADIAAQNAALLASLAATEPAAAPAVAPDAGPIRAAVAGLRQGFDPVHGGYGGAPKFPRAPELEFLLRQGDAEARDEVLFTLRRMAEGGLFDQLGGGFYRYAVDERWAIPHFEKMLYDNGPLLALYAEAWRLTGEPLFKATAERIVEWLGRELTAPDGGFYAALDADSEHEEGRFYVWTPAEAEALLTPEEYALAAPHWGLDRPADFEGRAWHLGVAVPLAELASAQGLAPEEAEARLASARAKLFAARAARVPPGRDDKVLAGWNALMVRGLALAARRFGRPDWAALAGRCVDFLRGALWREGRLLASWKDGRARHKAYLDDHAFLLDALIELMQAAYRPRDMAWARELAEALLAHFEDPAAGGFYFTSHDHERLIHRAKPAHDSATPSGNGAAACALGHLGHLLGEARYLAAAERALRLFQPALAANPIPHATLLLALAGQLAPPRIVVLRGPPAELAAWRAAAEPVCGPDTLLLALPPDTPGLPAALAKPCRETAGAHVCAGVNCLAEIVQIDELLALLSDQAFDYHLSA